jgi:hypothetical protein
MRVRTAAANIEQDVLERAVQRILEQQLGLASPASAVKDNPGLRLEYAGFARITQIFELPRPRQYELAGEGKIRVVKVGARSLVDVDSVRRYLAQCPPAPIAPPKGLPRNKCVRVVVGWAI